MMYRSQETRTAFNNVREGMMMGEASVLVIIATELSSKW